MTAKRVLVACEFSGVVREEFAKLGHVAYSCDYLESEIESEYHLRGDASKAVKLGWDIIIAFPPCTYLASSGARWWMFKYKEQQQAIDFFMEMYNATCDRVAVENPIGIMSTVFRKPDQIIQPWQFGHGETKATCLWLRGLEPLVPTDVVPGRYPRVHMEPPGEDRWKNRSRTYAGIARAMASQWGGCD